MRRKRLMMNTISAIFSQLTTLICGLILPRLLISYYGSLTNGLVSSITQFLALFSMMDMGVGAVVRASLYKPLADNDDDAISRVLISSKRFFNKIGMGLIIYSVILMISFPLFVDDSLGFVSTAILVGSMACNSLCNYMFGIVYSQLLNADQRSYVQFYTNIFTTVLNTVFSVILIKMGASIVTVKLAAAIVFLFKPIILKIYVDKHYKLNFKLKLTEEPLKQKWNGLSQHIANYVLNHADTVILTIFSSLENVSIYYVYHLVTNGLQQMVEVFTTGLAALLGNMYAKNETDKLDRTFSSFEWIMHTVVTLLYSIAGVLIIPFVSVYTAGVTDVNYVVPTFAILIVLANAVSCIRMPYNIMIHAAGHFKQTQASAIIEAVINVVISILFVRKLGLVGVAIGTFAAMCYRTIYLAWYLRKNILNRDFSIFVRHVLLDIVTVVLIIIATSWISMSSVSWFSWVICAFEVGTIAVVISAVLNLAFYRNIVKESFNLLFRRKKDN